MEQQAYSTLSTMKNTACHEAPAQSLANSPDDEHPNPTLSSRSNSYTTNSEPIVNPFFGAPAPPDVLDRSILTEQECEISFRM
jgi:hypothetical protein